MKHTRIFALLAALAVIVFFPQANARPQGGVAAFGPPRLDYVPGEVLVKYKSERATAAAQASMASMGAEIKKSFPKIGVHQVKLSPAMSVPQALQTFRNDPSVAYAEPNYLRYVDATTPDDTYFPVLWGLHNTGQMVDGTTGTRGADIHAPEAWDIAQGSSTVKVAVIDTGVDYNHPDLKGNLSPTLRYDFVNGDANPMDANNHGTHVAGTIAAVGNNGIGITGVSWTATIMPLRAGNAFGTLPASDIIAAIDYAVANGAKIINASYDGPSFSQAEYDAISRARDAGILFVAAAGNSGTNNDATPVYPANYQLDNIIAVAATDQDDNLAHFSNYGAASVHVAAPGVNIYSTKPARQTLWSDNLSTLTGWTTGGTNNTWGLSTTTYSSAPSSLAVTLAANYLNGSDSWAQAPVRNLASAVGNKLEFVLTGASESGADFLYVETSTDGTAWTKQDVSVTDSVGHPVGTYSEISGSLSQWYNATVDLGAYDGAGAVYIRFHFTSNNSVQAAGWFIDDVQVTAASTSYAGTEYQYLDGTSMATPHVTGLAALIWGFKPDLAYTRVKSIIMNSVDAKSTLTGKTVSGGRINAFNALYYTPPPAPGALAAAVTSDNAISLTWTDNSPNESGFHIERKPADGTYAQVAAVAANSLTYGDTGLSAGTAYCYRVAAFNNGGNGDYSNEVCATTSGAAPAGGGGGGGGCFIATAAFGSPWEGHVQTLRAFRDSYLLDSHAGRTFVKFYYRVSPPLAAVISSSDVLRAVTRWCLLPLVGAAYLVVHLGPARTGGLFLFVALLLGVSFRLYAAHSGRLVRRARETSGL